MSAFLAVGLIVLGAIFITQGNLFSILADAGGTEGLKGVNARGLSIIDYQTSNIGCQQPPRNWGLILDEINQDQINNGINFETSTAKLFVDGVLQDTRKVSAGLDVFDTRTVYVAWVGSNIGQNPFQGILNGGSPNEQMECRINYHIVFNQAGSSLPDTGSGDGSTTLPDTAEIFFYVIDAETQQAIQDARVQSGIKTVLTNTQGSSRLTLSTGTHQFIVSKQGYETLATTSNVPSTLATFELQKSLQDVPGGDSTTQPDDSSGDNSGDTGSDGSDSDGGISQEEQERKTVILVAVIVVGMLIFAIGIGAFLLSKRKKK